MIIRKVNSVLFLNVRICRSILMAGKYDNTSYGGGCSRFQTTEWTKILNPQLGSSILAELYSKYWRPVYAYLRRKGFNNEDAKDMVQGFFSDKVLGQQFLQKVDRGKGHKFRSFMLTSLTNYVIDKYRKGHPEQKLDDQIEQSDDVNNTPEIEFDIAWAKELLQSVLKELEKECKSRDKNTHWQVFKAWLLDSTGNESKLYMSEICKKYKLASPDKAYNMIANIKGCFQRILRRRILLHVKSEADVDDEIRYFIDLFSKYRKDFD